jgi:saccharopine dehydrogenase (NADP+, L-glutamate forming)
MIAMAVITYLCQEESTSTLELLGDPNGYSAMAKSVGVTCGIATQLLLDGHTALRKPGILAPYTKEICDPIRELLEKEGIVMVEAKVVDEKQVEERVVGLVE